MDIEIIKTPLSEIEYMRVQFLHEKEFQFVHNKCHLYGWADTYLFRVEGVNAGYGSVWGADDRGNRDCIFEFYLIEPYRRLGGLIFKKFCDLPAITKLEAQTNDLFQSTLVFQYGTQIQPEAILFEDDYRTNLSVEGAMFRKATTADREKMGEDDSEFIVEYKTEIAAFGGLMLNYNHPFADIYMAVKENFRQLGLGSFIVQELKKVAYLNGRVPAARCNVRNEISKATLLKAGLKVCGILINARVASKL